MSHPNVERVIGLLVTDERFRRRFTADPRATLQELADSGIALTPCEQHALAAMSRRSLTLFADAIDPRLQKSDLRGDECEGDPR